MLEVRNLKKVYKTKKGLVEAVKGISFEAFEGEVFAILGPNGAGKTTTIKSILGLVIPDGGEVFVDGLDVLRRRKEALKKMSAVLEGNRNVHWRLTVRENMEYFGALRGLGGRKLKERIRQLLEMFSLEEKMYTLAGQLSRGQQQKLALAIALLPDSPVVLLDEPTLGLDVESSIEIRGVIKEISRRGKLVLLSTHDMNLVEDVADRVMIMSGGRIVALDRKENLKGMFRSRTYRFVLEKRPSESLLERLMEFSKLVEDGENFVFEVDLSSPTAIYELFEILGKEKPPIKSIESQELNFERVFLKIIGRDVR